MKSFLFMKPSQDRFPVGLCKMVMKMLHFTFWMIDECEVCNLFCSPRLYLLSWLGRYDSA